MRNLLVLFFQSKFQCHVKFFCTVAKHPLPSPETNPSFFSFFGHFAGNLFGFSAGPLNLTCCSLSLERIHFLLIQTYIPVFCTTGTVPDSREQRCRVTQTPPSLCLPGPALSLATQSASCWRPLDSPSAPRPWSPYSPKDKVTLIPWFPRELSLYCDPARSDTPPLTFLSLPQTSFWW